jgi:hypothetical protein
MMANSCYLAYMKANPQTKRQLNQAFFKSISIKQKKIEEVIYTDLFDLLFRSSSNKNSLVATMQHSLNSKQLIGKLEGYFEKL